MRGRWAKTFAMLLPRAKTAARQCAVGSLATLAMLVWLMPRDDSIVIPLSIPVAALESFTWDEQRGAFGDRLERGYGLEEDVADEFAGWILEASTRQRLQPELIASLVMTESTFRKHARSSSGAVGPTQVKPDLWREFCGVDPLDPEQNVYCGAQILAHYRDACAGHTATPEEAEACALRSYNVGYSNHDNAWFDKAAQRYVAKIDRYLDPIEA